MYTDSQHRTSASAAVLSDPTPDQINTVKANLENMQKFNDYVYNQGGQSRISNAYSLLSEKDSGDPGLQFGLKILMKAFGALVKAAAITAEDTTPAIVSKGCTFLNGMLNSWSANPPAALNQSFSTLQNRVQETSLELDRQLAVYYQNVAANWDVSFTVNGQTVALSDLSNSADGVFPVETDPEFETLAQQALFPLDQSIWQYILTQSFYWVQYEPAGTPTPLMPSNKNTPPITWVQNFYAKNPAYYATWQWWSGLTEKGWVITEYSLGGKPSWPHDNAISSAACNYLFINSTEGVVINNNALFTRETVFSSLGIRQMKYQVP